MGAVKPQSNIDNKSNSLKELNAELIKRNAQNEEEYL